MATESIQGDDVRRLLDAGADAVLVVLEGRTEVIEGDQIDDDAHRGALRVISRAELVQRAGRAEVSDAEVTRLAAILAAEVSELGG
jgi:hypothetical protein